MHNLFLTTLIIAIILISSCLRNVNHARIGRDLNQIFQISIKYFENNKKMPEKLNDLILDDNKALIEKYKNTMLVKYDSDNYGPIAPLLIYDEQDSEIMVVCYCDGHYITLSGKEYKKMNRNIDAATRNDGVIDGVKLHNLIIGR